MSKAGRQDRDRIPGPDTFVVLLSRQPPARAAATVDVAWWLAVRFSWRIATHRNWVGVLMRRATTVRSRRATPSNRASWGKGVSGECARGGSVHAG